MLFEIESAFKLFILRGTWMNMNKKWGIFIMMIIIVALSACSQGNQEVQTDDEIELTAWAWNTNVAALNSAIQLYQEEHPNVRLKVEDIGRLDVYDKLSTGLASGGVGLPDIVLVEDDRIHGYLEAFPNGFLNLADFGFDKKMELFPSFKQALTSKDGVPYAFPYDAGPTGVFYRTDIFEQAGVDAASIQTWEDYINAGIKIKETTDTLMVPVDKFNDDALFRMMMNQSGVYYFDQEGNIDFNHPDVIRAMETLSEMDQAGIIKNVIGWDGTVSATVDGSVATIPFGAWYYGTIIDQAKDTDGKWGVFLLPAFEAGGNRAANLGGSSWMIPAESEHKESVYDFMEFFATSDEVQQISMEKPWVISFIKYSL